MEHYLAIKEGNPAICNKMDKSGEHSVKWNKSDNDKDCMVSLICKI